MPMVATVLPRLIFPQPQLLNSLVGAANQQFSPQHSRTRPIPIPRFAHAGRYFSPAWHGLPTVSALIGRCCSLAQPEVAHMLSWLSCMPCIAVALPGLTCPQLPLLSSPKELSLVVVSHILL